MTKDVFTSEKLAEMQNLYENSGLRKSDLAKKYGCSIQTISYHLKKLGVQTRKAGKYHYQHEEEVKAKGRIILVGLYLRDSTKTKYRCLEHNEVHFATPSNILKTNALKCCRSATLNELARKKSKEAAKEFDKKLVQKQPNMKRINSYIDSKTPIKFKCLTHQEIHAARPGNVLSGQGLLCCQKAARQEQADSRKEAASRVFSAKLKKANPFLVPLEEYIGNGKKILFYCKKHKEKHLAWPGPLLRRGSGLKCCMIASIQERADKKKDVALKKLESYLDKNDHIKWIDGEYNGRGEKLTFYCQKHKESHLASPKHIVKGHGLKCCQIEATKHGGTNTVWQALLGEVNYKGGTFIYLYRSPSHNYYKYGISNNLKRRVKDGGYGEQLIEPRFYPEREDAILIEQAFKYGWGLVDCPEELNDWAGNTELTQTSPDDFVDQIVDLEEKLYNLGRWKFAEEYCDPLQLKIAKDKLTEKQSSI